MADGELRSHQLKNYFRELEEYKSRRTENSISDIIPQIDLSKSKKTKQSISSYKKPYAQTARVV